MFLTATPAEACAGSWCWSPESPNEGGRNGAAGHTRAALVALTGYGRESDVQRSREAGFDHHLVEPVDLGRLRKITADLHERLD